MRFVLLFFFFIFSLINTEEYFSFPIRYDALLRCGFQTNNQKSPWLAAVQGFHLPFEKLIILCSGALINDRYVLTLAQCVKRKRPNYKIVSVVFHQEFFWNENVTGQRFYISHAIAHPRYNQPHGVNNVALLRLSSTVPILGYAKPLCAPIPDSKTENFEGRLYLSTWFDFTSNNPDTTAIFITFENCQKLLRDRVLSDHEMCTEYIENSGKDKRYINLGAPLLLYRDYRWHLQGILTRVTDDNERLPLVYLNVSNYLDWIEHVVQPYPESCFRDDLFQGECFPLEECMELSGNKTNPSTDYLETPFPYACLKGQTNVCCDVNKSDASTKLIFTNEIQSTNVAGCGTYETNGDDLEFPWTVEIKKIADGCGLQKIICVGTLINTKYVISTASCVDAKKRNWGESLSVRVGDFNGERGKDCDDFYDKNYEDCYKFQDLKVDNIIVHPSYVEENKFNDIALLSLRGRVVYSDYIRPICFPISALDTPIVDEDAVYISSWLKTPSRDKKFTIKSKFIANEKCHDILNKKFENVSLTLYDMCTSGIANLTDANNIIGAAVYFSYNNKWFLEGIGYRSAHGKELPTLHANISLYLNWIKANLKNKQCITPDGDEGDCVAVNECPSLQQLLLNPLKAGTTYFRNSKCGTLDEFCCPLYPNRARIDKIASTVAADELVPPIPNLNNIDSYCGFQQVDSYFPKSDTIGVDEFPWLAIIRTSTPIPVGNRSTLAVCGGALINARYVLTAAQCLNPVFLSRREIAFVRLGAYHVVNKTSCVHLTKFNTEECSTYIDYNVEETIMHPYYDTELNDIGLIRLNQSVAFSDYIRPICIPPVKPATEKPKLNVKMYITGFGLTANGQNRTELKKKVEATLISNEECKLTYIDNDFFINTNHICTKDTSDTKDISCLGDGGGPLMYDYQKKWYVEGILVRGLLCEKKYPEIHTKVFNYVEWIMRTMKPWTR